MNPITPDETTRITATLHEKIPKDTKNKKNTDDCYYVYMLATKSDDGKVIPFYIGK